LSFPSIFSGDLDREPDVDLLRVAFKSSSSSKKSWRPPTATIEMTPDALPQIKLRGCINAVIGFKFFSIN